MISHLPNIVSGFRIICLPIFIVSAIEQNFVFAFYVLLASGLSDALDGFIAKGFDLQSRLGTWLDPLADKIMLLGTMCVAIYLQWLPLWFFACILLRDLIIVVLSILQYQNNNFQFEPHWSGKVSTFLQFILLLFVVADIAGFIEFLTHTVVWAMMFIILTMASWSLIFYLKIGLAYKHNAIKN